MWKKDDEDTNKQEGGWYRGERLKVQLQKQLLLLPGLPERARSEDDVGVEVDVPLPSIWLLWSESDEDVGGAEESAELSTEDELEGGGAVTVEDDPEEEEEVDWGIVAVAGSVGASGAVTPEAVADWPESWLGPPAWADAACGVPSGRTAVPETHILVQSLSLI